jgi:phosphopantetheinyl transferase
LRGFFVEGSTPSLILNPVLLDAIGQVAACWYAQQVGTDFNAFPSTFERLELYQHCPENIAGLEMLARQTPVDSGEQAVGAARQWQFECRDSQGRPLLRMANLANVFFPVPHRFYQVRRDPLNGWLGALLDVPAQEGALLWRLENFAESFLTQSGGVFMTILAHAMLSLDERADYYRLEGSARRRMEWLQGRLCLKEAVRHWLYQHTGTLLYPSEVVVGHNALGAPFVSGWWTGQLLQAPEVSLTHDRYQCIAAVSSAGQCIGVDLEKVGRVQNPEHVMGSFTPREQSLLRGVAQSELPEKLLRIWCAKEAAAKFFGGGMRGDPSAFEVEFADTAWDSATVSHGTLVVDVQIIPQQDSILAVACQQRYVSQQDE